MLDATIDDEWYGRTTVELHCPFHVHVEGYNQALYFWSAANLFEDLRESLPADQIKYFCEVNEGDVECICCSLNFFWNCRREKIMSIIDFSDRKAHCDFGYTHSASFCSLVRITRANILLMMLRREMPL